MQKSLNANKRTGVITFRQGFGYALMLALLPVIMMYKVPGINMGLSTVLIAVSMFYAGIVILCRAKKVNFSILTPIYLYLMWNIARSDGNIQSVFLCIAIMVHLTAISTGIADVRTMKKVIINMSCIAAVAVIFQQLCYTLFSIQVPMLATDLLLNPLQGYGLRFGEAGVVFRPSAFFLEPSHLAQYCFIGMALCLVDKESWNIKRAAIISIGIISTTSGMGIGMVIAAWGYYFISRLKGVGLLTRINRFFLYGFISIILIAVASQVPIVQYTLTRAFTTDTGEMNAITGRLFWWDTYIEPMSSEEIVTGFGHDSIPEKYFTGIMEMIYGYGMICVALFYWVLIDFFRKGNILVRFISLMLAVLMIVANLSGFISVIFYFGVIITLICEQKKEAKIMEAV